MSSRILRSLLDKIVQHKRPSSYTVDAGGGRTPVHAVLNADVPAAIAPMAADKLASEAFERRDIVVSHAIYTDRDLAVKADDLIVHGTDVYLVADGMKFNNEAIMRGTTVYVIAADLRTV